MDAFVWVALPALAVLVSGATWLYLSWNLIADNWLDYRCNPLVMPLAGAFGHDAEENFEFCMDNYADKLIALLLEPFEYMATLVGSTLSGHVSALDAIRGLLLRIKNAMFGFLDMVMHKMLNGMSEVMTLMVRVRDLFDKLVGAGMVQLNLTVTLFSFLDSFFTLAMSLVKALIYAAFSMAVLLAFVMPELLAFVIPLGAMLGIVYCFDPDTPVPMADGSVKPMKLVRVGEQLATGDTVTAVYLFDGSGVPLSLLRGVVVSNAHKVYYDGRWVYVGDHPGRRAALSLGRLCCLATSSNTILLNEVLFADYEELSDPDSLRDIAAIAGTPVESSSPCFNPLCELETTAGRKSVSSVCVGDILLPGHHRVEGVVRVQPPDEWVSHGDVLVSCSTLLSDLSAPHGERRECLGGFGVHFITSSGVVPAGGWLFRDYADSHDPDVLQRIEEYVLEKKNVLAGK